MWFFCEGADGFNYSHLTEGAVQTENGGKTVCNAIQVYLTEALTCPPSGHQRQTPTYLSCNGRPDFQRVVVRAADNAVAAELEAGDHVVVMTFQHLWDGTDREERIQ